LLLVQKTSKLQLYFTKPKMKIGFIVGMILKTFPEEKFANLLILCSYSELIVGLNFQQPYVFLSEGTSLVNSNQV
jgi:hypothetical protein